MAFVVDKSVNNHTRAIYDVLKFLGDIGGLYDALKLIAWFLTAFSTFGNLNDHITS